MKQHIKTILKAILMDVITLGGLVTFTYTTYTYKALSIILNKGIYKV